MLSIFSKTSAFYQNLSDVTSINYVIFKLVQLRRFMFIGKLSSELLNDALEQSILIYLENVRQKRFIKTPDFTD